MLRIAAALTLTLTLVSITQSSSGWVNPFSDPAREWDDFYLAPESEYGPGHRGVDLAQDPGSKIRAPLTGSISFVGLVVDRQVVSIRSTNGYLVSFEPACTKHKVGDSVLAGEEFAWHCSPKGSYQYHCENCVHFSIRSNYGYLSPDFFLGDIKPSVLLG